MSPDGNNVYVAASEGVAVFARARRTGVLTQLRGKEGCVHSGDADGCARARALGEGVSVAVSPDGSNVYVAAEAVAVFARDRKSGALSQLRGKNGCLNNDGEKRCTEARALGVPNDVAVSPDGRASTSRRFRGWRCSPATARRGRSPSSAAKTPAWDNGGRGGCADGRALDFATGVAVSPDGKSAYVASGISDAVAVFARQ